MKALGGRWGCQRCPMSSHPHTLVGQVSIVAQSAVVIKPIQKPCAESQVIMQAERRSGQSTCSAGLYCAAVNASVCGRRIRCRSPLTRSSSKVNRGGFTPIWMSQCFDGGADPTYGLPSRIGTWQPFVNNLTSDPGAELLEVSGFLDSAYQLRERRSMKPQALRRARIDGAIRAECG
jgi:hypothetical protein